MFMEKLLKSSSRKGYTHLAYILEEGVIPEDDDEITQQSGDVNETQRSGRRDSPEAWPDDDGVMSTRSKDPVNVDSSSKIDEIIAKLVEAKNLMSR